MATRGGRNSVPWSRLKPVNLDPLESMGLPSKGDNRYSILESDGGALLTFLEQAPQPENARDILHQDCRAVHGFLF